MKIENFLPTLHAFKNYKHCLKKEDLEEFLRIIGMKKQDFWAAFGTEKKTFFVQELHCFLIPIDEVAKTFREKSEQKSPIFHRSEYGESPAKQAFKWINLMRVRFPNG